MRHMVVRRTATLLGTVLIACSLLFGLVASRRTVEPSVSADAASSGAAAYRRYCASCHTVGAIRPSVVGSPERRREMELFLREHGRATEAEDRLILDYIESQAP